MLLDEFKPVLLPEIKPILLPDLQQANILFQPKQQLKPQTAFVRNYVGDPEADMTVVSIFYY